MANIIKLIDGSEFEFEKKDDLDIELIQKVANLNTDILLMLVTESGVDFESKPTKTDLVSCLDEIDASRLQKLYDKYVQQK
jgi:hypothetical protein